MRRALKLLGFLSFAVVFFIIVVGLAFYHLIRVGEFRRFLIRELEQKTELKVQLGKADFEFGRVLGIVFNDVALSEPGAPQPAVTAERVTARVALAPLLERKLIFYEVRLRRPRAQLVRDRHGHIAVLDKLLHIPFLKHDSADFNLDLRSIKIVDADVTLLDQRLPARQAAIRLHRADIDVQRLRGQGLREFVARLTRFRQAVPQGPALEIRFVSFVEQNGKQMTVRSGGKLVFPQEDLEFDKAWWDADVQLINVPVAMVPELTRTPLAVNSLSGHFVQRLHMEGNPAQRLHIKGDMQFKQLAVDAPAVFSAPLTIGDGRADYEMNWTPRGLRIDRLDYRAQQMKFLLKGDVGFQGTNPRIQVELSALSAPLAVLRKYLPLKAMGSPQLENWSAVLEEGEIELKKAGVNATLSQLRAMDQTEIAQSAWFDAELRNVEVRLGIKGALPLREVQGDVGLEKGVVAFKNVQGNYGESRFFAVGGTYRLAGPEAGALDLQGRGELDLAELRTQLELGVFPADLSRAFSSVQEIGGNSRIDFTLRRNAAEPLQFAAEGFLDNVRLRVDDLDLSEISGSVSLSPKEIKAEGLNARLFGSPVEIRVTTQDYAAENGRFDLRVVSPGIKAGVVTRLLLDSGSVQDPGVVRGSVRYRGFLEKIEGREFTGQLDLAGVRLLTRPLLEPIEDLKGRIRIEERGIDFQNIQGVLAGFPVSLNGRWLYGQRPQLQYDLTAPNLDITQLLALIDPETTEIYGKLRAQGQVKLERGRFESFQFRNLNSAVDLDRRVWRLTDFHAEAAGGDVRGTATIADKPDTLAVSLAPKIQGVPVRSFFGWFDIETSEVTGKVNLTGKVETTGKNRAEREKNLNGVVNLRVENGTLHRLRILVQILNLLDLSRWFTFRLPDLEKQGIRFRAITGDFQIKNGVYSTENLFVDSDDLRMTGAGKIDVPKNDIDFVVAVRPFAGIDTVINYIPLIGRGIAAIKNSFMVASFNIKGPIDNPLITPAPLSTLSEVLLGVLGIPKNILGSGGEGNKGKPTKESPTGPTGKTAPRPAP